MSVRTMARVWADSEHSGTHLLMLLAIADFADDDGNAYPAVPTLAAKCRMKPRNANVILAALRKSGELEIRANEGPRGTNLYRVLPGRLGVQERAGVQTLAGVQERASPTPAKACTTPAKACSKPLQRLADEPSLNHQEREASPSAPPSAGKSNKGTRLKAEWTLSAVNRAYCEQRRPDLDPETVAENFRDYWIAKPGKDGCKLDWDATFRQWVRKERATGAVRSTAAGRRPVLNADEVFTVPA